MKLQEGDTVVPIKNRYLKPDRPMPQRVFTIAEIEVCKDKDKECPKDCPGMISLDWKEFKCYAFESNEPKARGKHKLVIQKTSKNKFWEGFQDVD